MHPRNKLRLLAGLTIDTSLEVTAPKSELTEARDVPMRRSGLKPKNRQSVEAHAKGVTKAIAHLKNAVKVLERLQPYDFSGDIPHFISLIDEVLSGDGSEGGLTELQQVYQNELQQLGEAVNEQFEDEVSPSENPADPTAQTPSYKKGDVIMFDNGVWIIHVTDPGANKVGIIPPSMRDSEETECAKAMQMVDPAKIRAFDDSEKKVLPGPDGVLGTEDDIRLEGEQVDEKFDLKKAEQAGYKLVKPKATGSIKRFAGGKKKKKDLKETTNNFTPSNAVSHVDDDSTPVNAVAQDDKSWDKSLNSDSVKSEIPTQLDNRGEQCCDESETKVKVPASLKQALTAAIGEFEGEVKKMEGRSAGGTVQETAVMYANTAAAFQKILDYLNEGTIESIKQAQIFTSSLMGPMLHKLPDGVWDFISNGGQKRSLKDYVNQVKG